ncbi:Uncharacterised protein [Vibrio cholerae]|nr:Uncharacterised protein [Vibrio cholerae]
MRLLRVWLAERSSSLLCSLIVALTQLLEQLFN